MSSGAKQGEDAFQHMAVEPVSVLIVDDHPIFRYGLHRLLETQPGFAVVGEAANGLQAVTLARKLSPQVVLLDLGLPDRPGLEVLGELGGMNSGMRTIILTVAIDKANIVQAIKLGARGIVLKEAASELLIECIGTVLTGRYWVGREILSDVVQLLQHFLPGRGKPNRPNFGLSARELEVVAAITAGYSNKEIAQKLSLSEQTVKHHITNIFDKLGVSNRMELVLFAVSHQLVDAM